MKNFIHQVDLLDLMVYNMPKRMMLFNNGPFPFTKMSGVSEFASRFKFPIGHFRVAVNLIMKARLSAKPFIRKLVFFAYE